MTLDDFFAAIRPPLVVHRAVIGRRATPCGLIVSDPASNWTLLTSLEDCRVTCPGCAGARP